MWDETDKQTFSHFKNNNMGQIDGDTFSTFIQSYSSNDQYKTFLEIGTWNGLGSTKHFVQTLSTRDDDFVFYSLECNADKAQQAMELYQHIPKVHILNEVIWNEEPADFYEIFPQCKSNELYKKWNTVDMINMKKCNVFLNRPNLPKVFDVLLLDGGEFTTYYEFQLLKDKCKILMLDDIYTDKCKLIVDEIKSQNDVWKIIHEEKVRNGFLIAEKCT